MAKRIRRILVAVGDLQRAPRAELNKAATLAKAADASIELFHCISQPDPGRSFAESVSAETVSAQRAAVAADCQRRLERFARSLPGLRVTCTAVWDYPAHEAVIRRAQAIRADLVVAASRGHGLGARLLLRNTDWELIRHCPIPLLLVKSRRPYRKPVVVAAVDPFHAHARPADLDTELLRTGRALTQLLHGRLHAFHAFMPLYTVELAGAWEAAPVMLPPEAEEAHSQMIESSVGELAASAGIPRSCRHVCMGDVSGELAAVTRRTHASLVIMGAVSRSALKRLFIGNTAERVLDQLECDVLVVKPRGFRSGVSTRRALRVVHSARTSRASRPRQRAGRDVAYAGAALPPLL
jgi:universal stress protein E